MGRCWIVVVLLLPVAGRATPPCQCEPAWSLPANGAVGVPLDAQPVVTWPGAASDGFSLAPVGRPADAVALDVLDAGGSRGQLRLLPAAALEPETEYVLAAERSGGGSYAARFTTGERADTGPPVLAGAAISGGALIGDCPSHTAAVVALQGAEDDSTPAGGLLIEVTLADPPAELGEGVILLSPVSPVLGHASDRACLNNAPGVVADRGYEASLRLIDRAGNASAAVGPLAFSFRRNPAGSGGCGCGPARRPAAGWLLAGLLLLLAAVRLPNRFGSSPDFPDRPPED